MDDFGSSDFTLRIQADFDKQAVWVITVRFRFREGLSEVVRNALVEKGRLAVLDGVNREVIRGRTLRADTVRVQLDAETRLSLGELPEIQGLGGGQAPE